MNSAEGVYGLVLALLFAIAAGLVGSFALMKRMLLASDVMSHVALPGLGLAFLLGFDPLVGAASSLFLGTLLIWQLQEKTGMATEAMIGVVFAGSLAIGAALTPQQDLIEALFGRFQPLSLPTFLLGLVSVFLIIFVIFRFKDQLVLSLFSSELAAATSVPVSRLNLYFLLAFSLTVLVGLRFMGALLAGTLVIIPAATGRRWASNLSQFLLGSCLFSVAAVTSGLLITTFLLPRSTLGPIVILISALFFGVSLLKQTS